MPFYSDSDWLEQRKISELIFFLFLRNVTHSILDRRGCTRNNFDNFQRDNLLSTQSAIETEQNLQSSSFSG